MGTAAGKGVVSLHPMHISPHTHSTPICKQQQENKKTKLIKKKSIKSIENQKKNIYIIYTSRSTRKSDKTTKKKYKTNLSQKKSQNERNDQAKIKRIFLRRYQSFIYSNVMKQLVIIRLSQKTRKRNRRRRFRSEKQTRRARPGQIPARRPHSRVSSAPAGTDDTRCPQGVRRLAGQVGIPEGKPDRCPAKPTGATRTGARPT